MRLRYVVGISMLLLGFIFCTAQINSAAQVGAAVENIRLEDGSKAAFIRVVNNSGKDITAFNLSVDVTFKNGKASHFEHTTDFLPGIISGGERRFIPETVMRLELMSRLILNCSLRMPNWMLWPMQTSAPMWTRTRMLWCVLLPPARAMP